jgi:outer membrane lipoprotein SlyB
MNIVASIAAGAALCALVSAPASAQSLSSKDKERVARAAPRDQDDVYNCLKAKKKGAKKGTIIGAAGGAGTALIAGGNLGETALASGAGALAGNLIGKGTSTNKYCDDVLARNK